VSENAEIFACPLMKAMKLLKFLELREEAKKLLRL